MIFNFSGGNIVEYILLEPNQEPTPVGSKSEGFMNSDGRILVEARIDHENSQGDPVATNMSQGVKTPSVVGEGDPLTLATTMVKSVTVFNNPSNKKDCYLGVEITNQLAPLPLTLSAPPGRRIDLSRVYVKNEAAGEGVFFITMD